MSNVSISEKDDKNLKNIFQIIIYTNNEAKKCFVLFYSKSNGSEIDVYL